MVRRLCALFALALAVLLVAAPVAMADAFDDILRDYQADGKVDPCKHSEETLREAQGQIPNDIEQYAPDLPASLKAALEARARGACDKNGQQGQTSTTPGAGSGGAGGSGGTTTPAPTSTAPTAPGTPPAPPPTATPAGGRLADSIPVSVAESDAAAPAPVLLLAILGGLLLAAGLFVALARFMGWGFEGLQPAWHNVREASWRGENAWYEFWDWVRLGR